MNIFSKALEILGLKTKLNNHPSGQEVLNIVKETNNEPPKLTRDDKKTLNSVFSDIMENVNKGKVKSNKHTFWYYTDEPFSLAVCYYLEIKGFDCESKHYPQEDCIVNIVSFKNNGEQKILYGDW